MEFKKYNSIENSYRTKEIQRIELNFPKEPFIVQEKVHGANFSFWINKDGVRCAKRTSFLEESDSFYNFQEVLERYKTTIENLYIRMEGIDSMIIHGELCGGNYPNIKSQVKSIQKGVYYSPNTEFIAFDITINDKIVNMEEFNGIMFNSGIPYTKELYRGTLRECLKYSNNYNSTVPELFGFDNLDNNICEGNVIKPVNLLFHGNGSRVVLKNKNEKFKEISGESKTNTIKVKKEDPIEVSEIKPVVLTYINENRLKNVLSKIGPVSGQEFGKIMGLFSKDVVEDLIKDCEDYLHLEKLNVKKVNSFVNKECGNLIRANFLNIIDGEF